MYRIKVIDKFSSAHQLKGYMGKCESMHGHNWKVEVEVKGDKLDKVGLLMDFKKLKEVLGLELDKLDHCVLNELEPFKESNPSSEIIAEYIYKRLEGSLPQGVEMSYVTVWESDTSRACYSK